ncbi:uncharacterized protein LOC110012825 [Sesamum indicum]|uniref:Uncharacterized protein LOC110012825 n=1 Tax=Sesamum indicum TaxID=4182 RepID=A0A8M8VBE7_SESIN|nr:uncharacterized protein LOC110012825 [Sesamum indicum]
MVGGQVVLLVCVDDILVTAPSKTCVQEVKQYLHDLFTIKDLGAAKYFLGIELTRSPGGMLGTQSKYISDIVQDMGLVQAITKNTPLPTGIKLTSECGNLLSDPSRYRRLIGSLLYLSFTRPDVSYAIQQLSQFLQKPCQLHWYAAVHLVKYLRDVLLQKWQIGQVVWRLESH